MAVTLVQDFVERWAENTPDASAVIESSRQTTYSQLDALANRFAQLLLSHGVERGDRVVIALENSLELVAAYLGTMKAGAVAVPLTSGPKSDRLAAAIADCGPCAALIDSGTARAPGASDALLTVPSVFVAGTPTNSTPLARSHRELAVALDASSSERPKRLSSDQDVAAIIYTSGSTGAPTGVMLSHRNFVANAESIVSYLKLAQTDRVMCVLPFHYVYGLSLLHTHLAVGGSIVIENRAAFPNVVLDAMAERAVTGFAGVPSTFALMLHRSNVAAARLPHLRYVTQAGGGMPPAKITEWLERGLSADFYVMYGATEAAARLTYLPPADLRRKVGSIGRAIPNVEIRVVTESGRVAAVGEVGELVARGANISRGYWNRPKETAERFGSGGYRTGDLGYVDDEGFLFLVGRQHDMIKVGANRVGAREIEDVLYQHPAVLEVAVVGAPHDLLGEAPVAMVSLKVEIPNAETELRGFCAGRLVAYKVPVRVLFAAELPKLAGTGKLDRQAVRAAADSLLSH
jgi:long-chain acyl-CoA synthetase